MIAAQEAKRGLGTTAVFIARNRFAVLDKGTNQIQIRNLQNEITKKSNSPTPTVDAIFYAGTGALLCRSEDRVGSIRYLLQPRALAHYPASAHIPWPSHFGPTCALAHPHWPRTQALAH